MTFQIETKPGTLRSVGLTGLILFSCTGAFSLFLLCRPLLRRRREPTRFHRPFFLCMFLTAAFDLPRYVVMFQTEDYESKWTYCLHFFANMFFFWGLSLLFYLWNALIQSRINADRLRWLLELVNGAFVIITLVSVVWCARAHHLHDFFASQMYLVYTRVDCAKNTLFMTIMNLAGIQFLRRLQRSEAAGISDRDLGLRSTIRNIVVVLTIATLTFVLRGFMVALKSVLISKEKYAGVSWFPVPMYSYTWWVLSDFVPRFVNEVTFQCLLANSRRTSHQYHRPRDPRHGGGEREPSTSSNLPALPIIDEADGTLGPLDDLYDFKGPSIMEAATTSGSETLVQPMLASKDPSSSPYRHNLHSSHHGLRSDA